MLEKDLERKFVNILRKAGCIVYKFTSPGNAGVPDRLVITPDGKIYFVELKRPGGKMRPLQLAQAARLAKNNVKVYLVDSMTATKQFMKEVGLIEQEVCT